MQLNKVLSADDIFCTVYKEFKLPFSKYASRILGDTEAAHDILHDTFVKAWEARGTFHSVDKMKAYIGVCSRNACIDRLRSIKCHQKNRREIWQRYYKCGVAELPEDICNGSGEVEILRAIKSLEMKYQECICMFYFQKLNCAKIAQKLNIKERNVRYFLSRGRVLIKMALCLN